MGRPGLADATVTVAAATKRAEVRRFAEVPFALHRHDPCWRASLRAFDQWRIPGRRHPLFERGDGILFLARRAGRPVGRISAHVDRRGEGATGWFGFLAGEDAADVTEALVDAAAGWLLEAGATAMTGPLSWTAEDEWGLLVDGFDAPAVTGRPWHPRWYAGHLRAAGFDEAERRRSHRLDVPADLPPPPRTDAETPAVAGRFADPRLVVAGGAAVPDLTEGFDGAGVASAWSLAKRAKQGVWSTAVTVRVDDDPAEVVPRLLSAASAAGYRELVAPWAPSRDTRAETTHALFTRPL